MISTAKSFINNWAPKDSKIGIVEFDYNGGRELAYLTPINTAVSRKELMQTFSKMTQKSYGSSNIGRGIRKGINVRWLE